MHCFKTATLALAILLAAASARAQPLSVLSYNVHGISWLFAKDNPGLRSAAIGWLASSYDVVLLQEDFEYHADIRKQMPHAVAFRGNGVGTDPRRLLAALVMLPFNLLIPNLSMPYGSGLSAFVAREAGEAVESTAQAYGDCGGWFGQRLDCWAQKGFLRVRLRTSESFEVDLYNTHFDAGGGGRSTRARQRQLTELAAAVEELSADRAVIVVGDFNTSFVRAEDRAAIHAFRKRLGLDDSGAGPELPQWRNRDFVLYRSAGGVTIEVEAAGEALQFVNAGRALSDHPALFARLRLSADESKSQ